MSDIYIPGVWSKRYSQLPPPQRAEVDKEVDLRFYTRTGIARTLDPKKDRALANRWLRVRDEVMAQMAGKTGTGTSRGLALALPAPLKNMSYLLLYNYDVGDPQPKTEHFQVLHRAVAPMLKMKGMELRVGVIGNASRTGDESANQALSRRRARWWTSPCASWPARRCGFSSRVRPGRPTRCPPPRSTATSGRSSRLSTRTSATAP